MLLANLSKGTTTSFTRPGSQYCGKGVEGLRVCVGCVGCEGLGRAGWRTAASSRMTISPLTPFKLCSGIGFLQDVGLKFVP